MGRGWVNTIKEANAQKKGKIFTKLAKEIAVAAKLGGPDPAHNARLHLAIISARAVSCPKDTIERAIKKGSGQLGDGSTIEELTYEGFGPHGVGVIVECQTDNKNRTVSELRTLFKSNGGNLGESGSVSWMFQRVALIEATKSNIGDPEEDAIEVGANEVFTNKDGSYTFLGPMGDLDQIRTALVKRGWEVSHSELAYQPTNVSQLSQEQTSEVAAFIDELNDFDDSHRVHVTLPFNS